jgi:hypothetical protein
MPSDEELLFGLRPNLTFDVIPAIWDNRPNVIRRADAFDAVALARHQPGSQQHVPQNLTALEASVDDTNADVVTRWAEGNISAAEITYWRAMAARAPAIPVCRMPMAGSRGASALRRSGIAATAAALLVSPGGAKWRWAFSA